MPSPHSDGWHMGIGLRRLRCDLSVKELLSVIRLPFQFLFRTPPNSAEIGLGPTTYACVLLAPKCQRSKSLVHKVSELVTDLHWFLWQRKDHTFTLAPQARVLYIGMSAIIMELSAPSSAQSNCQWRREGGEGGRPPRGHFAWDGIWGAKIWNFVVCIAMC